MVLLSISRPLYTTGFFCREQNGLLALVIHRWEREGWKGRMRRRGGRGGRMGPVVWKRHKRK